MTGASLLCHRIIANKAEPSALGTIPRASSPRRRRATAPSIPLTREGTWLRMRALPGINPHSCCCLALSFKTARVGTTRFAGSSTHPLNTHTGNPKSVSTFKTVVSHGRREIVEERTDYHFPLVKDKLVVGLATPLRTAVTPGVAGIRAIQDRANQVPYHGPNQEPVK